MDVTAVNQFISTVGFPVAMCCAMMYIMLKSEENHKNEVTSLKDSLNSNTNILSQLKQLLSDFLKNGEGDNHE